MRIDVFFLIVVNVNRVALIFCQDSKMFSLETADAKPMNLILTSQDMAYGLYKINAGVNIYVSRLFVFSILLSRLCH